MTRKALWNDIHETRTDFPHADPVGRFTVFNIKKNEYRLITVSHFEVQSVRSSGPQPRRV